MKSVLTPAVLKKFLKLAGDSLKGEWVVIGGTVLPIIGIEHRSTVDIDVVSVEESSTAETLKLMSIAEKLNLPIESINQAGAYFFHRIPDHRNHLVILHQGKQATLFRPDISLYLQLKMPRLSETDLADCLEMIKYCSKIKESLDRKLIDKALQNETRHASGPRLERLNSLAEKIKTYPY